jgi:hypothetical protein
MRAQAPHFRAARALQTAILLDMPDMALSGPLTLCDSGDYTSR